MRIIALINQKGGVGKTTTAANLGSGLARLGRRVLLLDIDPQANLSLHLDIDVFKAPGSIYDLLLSRESIGNIITHTLEPGLDIIPSHIDLCSAELELVNTVGREVILRDAIRQYVESQSAPPDYILIDCPPSLGLLSLNALAAAEEVIIPIQAEFFALQGMGKLVEVVNLVKSRLNAGLRISGIVVCMYRSQTTLAKEVLQEVQSFFGEIVFNTKIRQNIRLAEAPGHGKSIFDYDPGSNGAIDYMNLAREVTGELVPVTLEAATEDGATADGSAELTQSGEENQDGSTIEEEGLDSAVPAGEDLAAPEETSPSPGIARSEEAERPKSVPPMEGHSHAFDG